MEQKGFLPEICLSLLPLETPGLVGRAIYHPNQKRPLDFVWDRNGSLGDVDQVRKEINKVLDKIQEAAWRRHIRDDSSEIFRFKEGLLEFVFTPNASYGYAYWVAWLDKD